MRIGFIGAGRMGSAMARGWARADGPDAELAFTDAEPQRAEELAADLGGVALGSNGELAERSDVLVLAMKPAQLGEVAAEIADATNPVISMLGGTSLAGVEEALPRAPVVRVIPNQGVAVRRGVLCFVLSERFAEGASEPVIELLRALGTAIELKDDQIDAATAVMSCAPAYVALFADTLIAAGERAGLSRTDATLAVAETIAGTGELLRDRTPDEISDAVASPGGITVAGLETLDREGFADALRAAVDTTLEKMRG
ncbi:MAG: pyrroline-5-carboxylate reductase [Solirubrobacterales bacterium]